VQGTIRHLVSYQTGEIEKSNTCDAFGFNLTEDIPYAYLGKRYDADTNLIYFGKRYYDPSLRRWLTPDPLGPIDHSNLYQYVFNNPFMYQDFQGESVSVNATLPLLFWGATLVFPPLGAIVMPVVYTATAASVAYLGYKAVGAMNSAGYTVSDPDDPMPNISKYIHEKTLEIVKRKKDGKNIKPIRDYKNPKPKISGKEGAKDVPSWAKGNKPYVDEKGKDFAKRLLDEKYGPGNYRKGPDSEFNKVKKWGSRSWE